jgi:hypothetical protein
MIINNWYVLNGRCFGEVYDNPLFKDGTIIHTAPIQSTNGNVITTKNSKYTLHSPYNGELCVELDDEEI